MIYVIYGNEPYLVHRKLKELASGDGFFHHQEFSPETIELLWTDSFFGNPKGIVELEKSEQLNQNFFVYAKNPNENALLLIQIKDMNEKDKQYKELKSLKGVELLRCDKVSEKTLSQFVLSILKKGDKAIRKETLEHLLERADYDADGSTLYTVGNMVQTLCSATEDREITKELIDSLYPETRTVNKFHIASLIDKMDKRALYDAAGILTKDEGAISFLATLNREFRIAYKSKFFSPAEIGVRFVNNFKKWTEEELIKAMEIIGDTIEKQKRGLIPEEICIPHVFQKLIEIKEDAL